MKYKVPSRLGSLLSLGLLVQGCATDTSDAAGPAEVEADAFALTTGLDLSAAIQGQNSAVPGENIDYNILIRNLGTTNAGSFTVTLTATNAASLTVPGASCTVSGPSRTCTFGSSSLMRGFAFRKSVQVGAPASSGTVSLAATVNIGGDVLPANNTFPLSVLVTPLPAAVSIAPPQTTDNLVCAGSAPFTFADCVAAPSSYVPSSFTLNADHTVAQPGASATYSYVWSQPTPTTFDLTITTLATGQPYVVYQGTISAPKCFRGTIAYPGLSTPRYGAFQMCMTP